MKHSVKYCRKSGKAEAKSPGKFTKFQHRVYSLCSRVPRGRVTSYKEIARAMGSRAYRAVGSALNRNPFAPEVPCHRVVKSDGRIGGFASGKKKKAKMLRMEGIIIKKQRISNFKKKFYRLKTTSS